MTKHVRKTGYLTLCMLFFSILLSGCLTSAKLDKYVAKQYNNELPKVTKKKKEGIEVTTALKEGDLHISNTTYKTDKLLPLIVYWKYNHRQSCSLNSKIAMTHFTNAVYSQATKTFTDKLNGRKLELTLDQAPTTFSLVAKENMIWLIYAFSWAKFYVEPDKKDLIVSYKLSGTEGEKTGKITVKNNDSNVGLRYFQSWKSATSEYLTFYNSNMNYLASSFMKELAKEL